MSTFLEYADPETGERNRIDLTGVYLDIRQGETVFSHQPIEVFLLKSNIGLILEGMHTVIAFTNGYTVSLTK